ncbi:MAG: alcohol dehydrogenase [Pseudonocardia sp. SCN 72-86]|nr:MAG: alcohol dehydrogenase [Pseudonocardia sp. SCN 72-86]
MKTQAAVLHAAGQPFEIEELDVLAPEQFEVLVRWDYSGLCHSDLHMVKGHLPFRAPMVFGHEGAGEVLETGPGVTSVVPGDRFVASFYPVCGTCRWCVTGRSRLCDLGAAGTIGHLPSGRYPLRGPSGAEYGAMMTIGTFAQYGTVHEKSLVRVENHVPLDKAALVGCGVPTGWGSAVYAADVSPGDTVVIFGVGGIGMNAVQGAAYAGAQHVVVVDPAELNNSAAKTFGATHAVSTYDEARELVMELTRGVGAEKAIITVDTLDEGVIAAADALTSKGSVLVLTSMGPVDEKTLHLSGVGVALYDKTIKGSLYGGCNPQYDITKLLSLYESGHLLLDELITRTYRLDEVNTGYDDLQAHRNIRGVIKHEH